MGGGSSVPAEENRNETEKEEREREDQININVLYSALQKLSFAFELKESLTRSLTDVILDPAHKTFDDKLYGVEEWLRKFTVVELTHEEMYHLIKYVEVLKSCSQEKTNDVKRHPPIHSDSVASGSEPIPSDNLNFGDMIRAESLSSRPGRSDSLPSQTLAPVEKKLPEDEHMEESVNHSLICPYRSEIGAWIISIRSAEERSNHINQLEVKKQPHNAVHLW